MTGRGRLLAAVAVWVVVCPIVRRSCASDIDRQLENRGGDSAATLVGLARGALGLSADPIVIALDVVAAPDGHVEVVIPVAGEERTLELFPHSVRSEIYEVLAQRGDGSYESVEPGPVRTLRGIVKGVAGSGVAGSLLDKGLLARVSMPDGEEYWVEPLAPHVARASPADHVVYSRDSGGGCGGRCAMDEALGLRARVEANPITLGGSACGSDLCVAQMACDADVEYYQTYGSILEVEFRINAVTNAMNFQYERDVSITHQLTTIIVRTAEPDPYDSTFSLDLVNEFRDHWVAQQTGITRDVAQLFTGKDVNDAIGRAYNEAVVCDGDQAYCFAQSDYNSTFSCATDLSAHELGHLWSAVHCSCPSYTMNTILMCRNAFNPIGNISRIEDHRRSRACLVGAADLQPPMPTPMFFESPPAAISSTGITMTATVAVDARFPAVQYEFQLSSGGAGGNDSGWQTSRVYVDTGLEPTTTYGYRVRARDGASPPNVTVFSAVLSATTNPAPVCGDGVVEEDEECDPPDGVDCDAACRIIPPDCVGDEDCDDNNVCTDDTCVSGRCEHMNNTVSCVADACFPDAVCVGGSCREGDPMECDDGNVCTDDTCNPSVGCQYLANSAPCDDGDLCTANDACAGGTCVGDPVKTCDDGDPCTTNDTCVDGACAGTEPTDCDDGNPCTSDSCDSELGCVHEAVAGACDDGDACTTDDFCEAGACVGGGVLDCDDGDICTDDSCDGQSGCRSVANAAACDDGNICTVDDTCTAGSCSGTANRFGDANRDGAIDLFDIFCVLDGFEGTFGACGKRDVDIAGCTPDGIVDLQDILTVLDAFEGTDDCCGG